MIEDKMSLGLVQIYTGDGKGKTTAALGLGLRASGHGYKVLMIQFMKGSINYGELEAVKNIPGFDIIQFGRPDFVNKDSPEEIDIKLAKEGFQYAKLVVKNNDCDILILDEICIAVDYDLLKVEDVLALINDKPKNMELILTGRYAPQELLDKADLVSVIEEKKHPFVQGTMARKGIEY